MYKHVLMPLGLLPLAALAALVLLAATPANVAVAAEPGPEAARLERFAHPDGVNYFALSLKPAAAVAAPGPHDVVILVDTSASQAGDFRSEALGALRDTLSSLPAADRVHLMAVDLNAIPLTKTFTAPGSPDMAAALQKLEARSPLGTTDMEKALTAAVDSFSADSKNPRAVIYIGDGMSRANLLGTEKFDQLTARLNEGRIPVSCYAVGPSLDAQLLGALAAHSGGVVLHNSQQPGRDLANAAGAAVLWPTAKVKWPAGFTVYPQRTPPLRSDRDTVVVGTYTGEGPFNIQMAAAGPSGPQTLSWTVQPGPSNPDDSYLVQVVDQAKVDGGVSLPIVGSAGLAEAQREINAGVRGFGQLARQALASGDLGGAERLADEALRQDPNNPEALAVRGAVAKQRKGAGGAASGATAAPVEGGPDFGPDDLNLVGAGGGDFAEAVGQQRRLVEQVLRTQVQNAVNDARSQMGTDPELASQHLKLTLETVKQTADLEPATRDQLVDVIQAALREASRRQVEVEHRRQQRLEEMAKAQEELLINEDLQLDQTKMAQMMERFDSLMDEGQYRRAEEVAAEAMALATQENLTSAKPVAIAGTHYSRTVGYYNDIMDVVVRRRKGVVDTLYQVEISQIPTPDEPPILYPEAQVWQELSARRKKEYSSMSLAKPGAQEQRIEEALQSPTQLEFIETPLSEVVDFLKHYHEIEIQIDTKALDDVGVSTDTPITKDLKGISLKSALRLMLKDLDLTYMIDNEVLLITTPEQAQDKLTTKVYPVADLVLPINNNMMMGGMGMMGMGGMGMGGMGGMGGGMGMGGMGMGGMGMGGMGMGGMGMGGMGGMGRGMGGGMGWNVPPEVIRRMPAGGFQAFAVKDDLSVSAKSTAPASTPEKVEKIPLDPQPAGDPDVIWEQYFATHEPTPAAVREAVRDLRQAKRFDHVIALINAALRHHQVQSWMYDALTIAMTVEGRSREDIERAVMSAVDFVDSTADLMYVGLYLDRLGLDRRALEVFRQVAEMEPVQPEPYMHGLRAAQRLNDLEGKEWAALGIVRQAWTSDRADVWKTGLHVAKAILEELRAQKRTAEADRFEKALNKALVRDCVAVVSWTGDADVDLLVEEPSGTICSLRNPRTTAGGVMLGDAAARRAEDNVDGYREVYVCPQGFDGTYRMLVRRVWGKVNAGKVTVEVCTHYRGEKASSIRKRIPLKDDQAMVVFELTGGRRTEPLAEQQLANAVAGQMAVGRQILAQQLAAATDPGVLGSLASSRGGNDLALLNPLFRTGGAVGYQPVIITLPEGTMLMATAVVSADRRYVRISPSPMFSSITKVDTFNFVSGNVGDNAGGGGLLGGGGLGF